MKAPLSGNVLKVTRPRSVGEITQLKVSPRGFIKLYLHIRSLRFYLSSALPNVVMAPDQPPPLIGNEGPSEKRTDDVDGDEADLSSTEDYDRYIGAGLNPDDARFLASVPLKEQDRIFRKVDYRLIPCLGVLYFVAHLDRANIGNAKIEGLEASLGMSDVDYNIAVALFFIPYILCEVPSNYLLTRFTRPSRYMGFLVRMVSRTMEVRLVVPNS